MKASEAAKISQEIREKKEDQSKKEARETTEAIAREAKKDLVKIYKEIELAAAKGERKIYIRVGVVEYSRGYKLSKDELKHLNSQNKGYILIALNGKFSLVGEYVIDHLERDGYSVAQSNGCMTIRYGYEDDYGTYQSTEIGIDVTYTISW